MSEVAKNFYLSVWYLKKPVEWDDDSWEEQKKNITDQQLSAWWEDKFKDEKDNQCIQRIYDWKYNIALDPYFVFISYLEFHENINFEENPPKDKYLDVKEDLSTKQLKDRYPHIYKICYEDKISINGKLITDIRFKIYENKFKMLNDIGFTLNQIAYLGQQLIKTNFWFNELFRIDAISMMNLSLKDSTDNCLLIKLGCDIQ